MKVCFVIADLPHGVGGVSSWLQRLLPLLQTAGVEPEVHIMAFGGKPAASCAFFKKQGVPVRWMPFLQHLPYAVRSLLRFLEESRADIYVVNNVLPAFYVAGYARRAGIPTVGVLVSDHPWTHAVVDQFINGDPDFRVSAVVPVSTLLESHVSPTAAALGVMVRRIACGVPIPSRTAKLPSSVFRLVYTGRLTEEAKRVSDVARALCTVTQNLPNLEAWMTGEGGARPAVEAIIRETGMGSRVRLLGLVDNVYDVLAHCHCLVLLSDYEGLPTSVLEAMATGVVPICLDTRSGIREAIEHGVNGLVVKDRAADFFAAVKGLQSDLAKWRRLSLAAQETARQRYSIEECAREWVDLLEDLNRRRAARAAFQAPRVLRLPMPNPACWTVVKLPWKEKCKEYIKSIPRAYRIAKATVEVGRTIKGQAHRLVRKTLLVSPSI
jgi:glycosyltransferase involved in cell wall biosynthesis